MKNRCMIRYWMCVWALLLTGLAPVVHAEADMPLSTVRLVPAWELSGPLVMVWPESLSGGRRMIPSTLALIQALPGDVEVALASQRPPRVSWLEEIGRDIRYLPLTTVRSREVGEWAGFAAATPEGRLFSMRFQLPSRDLRSRDRSDRRDDYEASRQLGMLLYGKTREDIPVRMERLHLTHNGRGVALVSNRIIADNETLSLTELRTRLQDAAGLDTIVFVPVPASEPEGFIDGVLRFVGPRQLLVSEPLPGNEASRAQQADLLRVLEQELDEEIQVVRVPRPSHQPDDNRQPSYLNGIQIGNLLLCPQYGAPEDEPVLTLLRRQLPDLEIQPINGDDLSSFRLNRVSLWR